MLENYLKVTLRHIRKNSGFSLLNILGLSLGLACAILILLWVQDEMSYDKFHEKHADLYQVLETHNFDGKIYTFPATPVRLAEAMKTEIPQVKNTSRMGWGARWLFSKGDEPVYESGNHVDPGFFDMFSFPFIHGNSKTALDNDHAIVLTERMAKKFFNDENPVGKYLKANDNENFLITGVIADPPLNSSLHFDWLASFKLLERESADVSRWDFNSVQTFVELKSGTDPGAFNTKFRQFIKSKSEGINAEPFLHAMKDWRLRGNFQEGKQAGGLIEYVRLFSIIALLLVIVACINFMNLATARSEQRAKEVGIRKVMGAQRGSLMMQFIGESLTMSFLSLCIACLMVVFCLPLFNELVSKKLSIGFNDPRQWLIFAGIAAVCGVIAGSYPSIYLSSFRPMSIFRGFQKSGSFAATLIRKGLVVSQFVVSIALIIGTVVIYKQIEHVKQRHLGFNKNNLLYVEQKGKINQNLEVIGQDLLVTGVVSHATSCSQRLIQMGTNTGGYEWEGKDPARKALITTEYVGPDYVNTMGMKLTAGRDFYPNAALDSNSVMINEAFARLIGKKDPLGMVIRQDSASYRVVGVIGDFVFNNMYQKPDPAIFYCSPHETNFLFIRLEENADMETALSKIEGVLKKDNPGYPFEYHFIDADFDGQFKSEMLISRLSRLFAAITIVISCLGLFGLAAYTAERRTREIGIRKVLGASVQGVVALLSKDFLKLVLIAIVIASPLAWYFMNEWLQDYAYRVTIQWWMFVVAGAVALAICLLTVSFQAIKAALTNPVKSLRTE